MLSEKEPMSDVEAAAERIRRYRENPEDFDLIYANAFDSERAYLNDVETVAFASVAKRAARKAEAEQRAVAVDEAFELTNEIEEALRQCGFAYNDEGDDTYWWINSHEQDFDVQYWPDKDQFRFADENGSVPVAVEGPRQLRDLLKALKIESEK